MSAVLVKGLVISLSIVAALGIALQSPEVREWFDEQCHKLADILRKMGDGLDPQTRSQAEAFAFGARSGAPQNTPRRPEEANASAASTSREPAADTLRQRSQPQASQPPIDAAERRRLGREYLAKRNQELLDLKSKKKSEMTELPSRAEPSSSNASKSPAATVEQAVSSGTFNELINSDGTLNVVDTTASSEPMATTAFETGSRAANPFADEYAISTDLDAEGAITPRPPVPPKVSLEDPMPGAFPSDPPVSHPITNTNDSDLPHDDDFTFNTQLARALSLSLAESEAHARTSVHRRMTEDEELELAVRNSLSDSNRTSAAYEPSSNGPLVDFSSESRVDDEAQRIPPNPWHADDLYFLTPTPTGDTTTSMRKTDNSHVVLDSYLAPASSTSHLDAHPSSQTPSHTLSPALASSITASSLTLSPNVASRDAVSTGFQSDVDSDEFASLAGSVAHSTDSLVVVEDVDRDSVSDDDGIHTPQSWSEVSSEVGDGDVSGSSIDSLVRI